MTSQSGAAGKLKILCIAGARPNFIKLAPIMAACDAHPSIAASILHTGQHYDPTMSRVFFDELGIRDPALSLDIGSGSHAVQTGKIMIGIDAAMDADRPDLCLVVGDVNSTLASALVAKKKNIAVVHVEAGLRSGDDTMPEEINRILTDRLSSTLYTTEERAGANLLREGIDPGRIVFAGNILIDSLLRWRQCAVPVEATLSAHDAPLAFSERVRRGYAVATLHRPSNVDDPETLASILAALAEAAEQLPIILPVHPRLQRQLVAPAFQAIVGGRDILFIPPVGYFAMIGLLQNACLVMTDSGGVQEETTGLGIPCLTLRHSTERPITVTHGTNLIVGTRPANILAAFRWTLAMGGKRGRIPPLWDGRAAERIVEDLLARFG